MQKPEDISKELDSLKDSDAFDQSIALNKIVMQLLKTRAQECKRLWIALIISIIINLATIIGFLWYESQWEYTTTTTSTEISQDSEDNGLNLLQVGDNSRMFYGLEEDENGQTISEDYNNNEK